MTDVRPGYICARGVAHPRRRVTIGDVAQDAKVSTTAGLAYNAAAEDGYVQLAIPGGAYHVAVNQ